MRANLKAEKLNIKTLPERLKETGDLWSDFFKRGQKLDDAINRLGGEISEKT